ncbi:histidine phosphatase family protein [Lysinibacillus sp. BW-2-10]|nr:histidine phosphatase family protein [Lysinibacillus sp. BW-2-10]
MNGMRNMEIYFVRHGETEWNKEGRLQGWLNSKLTARGIAQAEKLKMELQNQNFQATYSSPLQRAIQTASILADQEIHLDDRLKEIHLGTWQGQLIEELLKDERYDAYCNKPAMYVPNGGETFEQVTHRMWDFLMDCSNLHQGERILVVTHGVAIRALLVKVMNLPIRKIWDFGEIDGTSVTKIVSENGRFIVESIGMTEHITLL